jgi:hypothetical protein
LTLHREFQDGSIDVSLIQEQFQVTSMIGVGALAHCLIAIFGES